MNCVVDEDVPFDGVAEVRREVEKKMRDEGEGGREGKRMKRKRSKREKKRK